MKEVRDIRLYYYESGGLRRLKSDKYHKFDNITDAVKTVDKFMESRRYKHKQFVITEYFGKYDSKIISILN